MFETGLEHYFKFDNKKRNLDDTLTNCRKTTSNKLSGTMGLRKKKSAKKSSKKRKINHHSIKAVDDRGKSVTQKVKSRSLPIISFGYTQSDCQVYGSNISTVAGTVKPSKMDGNLPKNLRKKIIELVEIVLEYIPDECTFEVTFLDSEKKKETRTMLMSELKEFLGGNSLVDHFRIEGGTILIPIGIGWHYDVMNCCIVGFDCVISVNVDVPINQKTFSSGGETVLAKWLSINGYQNSFPCSIILYSRKVVNSYCQKISLSFLLGENDLLRKATHWALCDRVGKPEDYLSQIWNNVNFPHLFKQNATIYKKDTFRGKCLKRTPAYNKMVCIQTF